jgi:hypothetical protein
VRRNHFETNDTGTRLGTTATTRLGTTATSCHISIIVHYFDFLIGAAIRVGKMS